MSPTRSGCETTLMAALTSSIMAAHGFRCGMRSLNATSSKLDCTSLTSLLNAGMARRSAESALHVTRKSVYCAGLPYDLPNTRLELRPWMGLGSGLMIMPL